MKPNKDNGAWNCVPLQGCGTPCQGKKHTCIGEAYGVPHFKKVSPRVFEVDGVFLDEYVPGNGKVRHTFYQGISWKPGNCGAPEHVGGQNQSWDGWLLEGLVQENFMEQGDEKNDTTLHMYKLSGV